MARDAGDGYGDIEHAQHSGSTGSGFKAILAVAEMIKNEDEPFKISTAGRNGSSGGGGIGRRGCCSDGGCCPKMHPIDIVKRQGSGGGGSGDGGGCCRSCGGKVVAPFELDMAAMYPTFVKVPPDLLLLLH
eukprot:TRINITY_DN5392_c3_g1_i2.p2 TRINITY_DN5392_c3_g1~~TRINITY_DN5392_c3_g1_i2.p2  ORF type:complete len:131 (-),score=68.34 TRINITY_DN5392_c3_g1_i2:397-789(-)